MSSIKLPPIISALFRGFASAFVLGAAWLLAASASAATDTWIGNTDAKWTTAANWSGGTAPASGDTLVFGVTGTSGLALYPNSAFTLGGNGTDGMDITASAPLNLVFTGTSPGVTITFNSSNGGLAIRDLSSYNITSTYSNNIYRFASAQTIQVGATTGAMFSSILYLNIPVQGGQRLTKTGNDILSLSNPNNALGGLTVSGGTVVVNSDTALSATAPASPTADWIVLDGGVLRTLNGGTALTINANRGISLGDAAAGTGGTLYNDSGGATTYNGIIANNGGTNSLTKGGVGIISLGGANTYTGATIIHQGQLKLDFTAAGAPASNIVNAGSALVMGWNVTTYGPISNFGAGYLDTGGNALFVQGSGTASSTQTFNALTVAPGYANLVARGNGAYNATVALGALSHNAGGTASFSLLTSGSTGQGIFTTTTANNASGILGGWATTAAAAASGTAALAATDWAANDGSGNIVAYTGYTIPAGASPVLTSNATSNIRLSSASTGTATLSAVGINDLSTIQTTDAAARTIGIGSGNTLRLGAAGGVWNTTAGLLTIGVTTGAAGGTLTAGGATDTAGEIVFNASSGSDNAITVNSVIANNGSGAVSVVKTGSAWLTLNGANTYSGGTYINQGQVNTGNAAALGTGDVTVIPGGLLQLSANTFTNNFNIAGLSFVLFNSVVNGKVTLMGNAVFGTTGSQGGTINGQITGNYSIAFWERSTAGGSTYVLSNSTNNYTGDTSLGAAPGDQTASASATMNVYLQLGANEVITSGAGKGNLILASADATHVSSLDLNGKTQTVNGLISADAWSSIYNTANGTTSSLTLGGNDVSATYAGKVLRGGAGGGTGDVAMTKIGTGTQVLSGNNTYTGATTISAGTLTAGVASIANVSGALGNNSAVTMANVAGARMDITGFNTQIGSLTGGGATGGNVTLGAATLTTGGDNTSPAAYAGVISGTGGVTKVGTGAQIFSGVNTYTGATTVSVGTLIVSSTGSLASGSVVTVASNAAIGGDGTIGDNLTLSNGAKAVFDSNNTPLSVTGTFALNNSFGVASLVNSSLVTIDWSTVNTGTYQLLGTTFAFDATTISNYGLGNALTSGGKQVYFTSGSNLLDVVVVPEPATWALLAFSLTAAMALRRRLG